MGRTPVIPTLVTSTIPIFMHLQLIQRLIQKQIQNNDETHGVSSIIEHNQTFEIWRPSLLDSNVYFQTMQVMFHNLEELGGISTVLA